MTKGKTMKKLLLIICLILPSVALADVPLANEARDKAWDAAVEITESNILKAIKMGNTYTYFSCHWDKETVAAMVKKLKDRGYKVETERREVSGFGWYIEITINWEKK